MMEIVGGYSELKKMPKPAFDMLNEHVCWEFDKKAEQHRKNGKR
jgi:hypothetical protein